MRRQPVTPLRIAVIGAGWAGCAAAVELRQQGHAVEVFEASRQPGGRARALHRDRDDWQGHLDNGQHILLGAYRETLRLMRAVGVDPEQAMLRLPLQMRYPAGTDGMDFQCPRLPAPWHLLGGLLRTRGLSRADKTALARFSTAARWIDWRLNADRSVTALLEQFGQTPRAIVLLWRPLCLAALNTPPDEASAQVFLNVLRDSLGARRADSDMLLPRLDLGRLFPLPALQCIARAGGQVRLGSRVQVIARQEGRFRIVASSGASAHETSALVDDSPATTAALNAPAFDRVIVALPPVEASRLLENAGLAQAESPAPRLQHQSITTCYLRYAPDLRLELPLYALRDDPALGQHGQFVFDRGHLDGAQAGILAVVISASTTAAAMPADALGQAVARQLATMLGNERLGKPHALKIVSEKRATFSCTPGLVRPTVTTGIDGLFRAGDHVAGDYPSTIEGAVRSGVEAARLAGAP